MPVLGSLLAHAPVLRFDLFPSLARPLDGGRCLGGRRIFGDNKTWRGALVMFGGAFVATVALWSVAGFRARLPVELQEAGPLVYGALLGLGVVAGELPNSFLKRQLGIDPGRQRRTVAGVLISLVDQGDFVIGVWLALSPVWLMPPSRAALAFAGVVVVHLVLNVVGYALGARKTWL